MAQVGDPFAADTATLRKCQQYFLNMQPLILALINSADDSDVEQLESIAQDYVATARRMSELYSSGKDERINMDVRASVSIDRRYFNVWHDFCSKHFGQAPDHTSRRQIIDSLKDTKDLIDRAYANFDEGDVQMPDVSTATQADPFADIRSNFSSVKAFDKLTAKARRTTEAEIEQAGQEVDGARSSEPHDALLKEWLELLVTALKFEPKLWRVALDMHYSQNFEAIPEVALNYDWAVGFFLRQFYTRYTGDAAQTAFKKFWDSYVDASGQDIFNAALDYVVKLLKDNETAIIDITFEETQPASETSEELVTLIHVYHAQNREAIVRRNLTGSLHKLTPILSELPQTKKAFEFYRGEEGENFTEFMADSNTLDIVHNKAYTALSFRLKNAGTLSRMPMPELTSEDLELVQRARATYYYPKDEDTSQQGEVEGDEDDEDPDAATAEDLTRENDDDGPHTQWLADHFNAMSRPVTFPQWSAPLEGPFTMQDPSDEAEAAAAKVVSKRQKVNKATTTPMATQAKLKESSNIFTRSTSFIRAREHTAKQSKEKLPDADDVVEGAARCLREQLDTLDLQEVIRYANYLLSLRQRPAAAASTTQVHRYDNVQMLDAWHHVRKFLQTIHSLTGYDFTNQELALASFYAAIKTTKSDPFLWVICVEGQLRNLWRALLGHKSSVQNSAPISETDWSITRNIVRECIMFAEAVSINALAMRYPNSPMGQDYGRLNTWYWNIYQMEPRCHNPDCDKLLPLPEEMVRIVKIRDLFSVGARDARVGTYSVRRIVSKNKKAVFPCFWDMCKNKSYNSVMAALFYLYGSLYHPYTRGSKPTRGKRSTNLVF